MFFGERPPAQGETPSPKIRDFWDIKLQIFGSEGAKNLGKRRVFKEKLAIFGVLRKIWPNFNRYSDFGLFWQQK